MSTALLIGLIAAGTAILGTVINFLSALLGHWYNRSAKIEEWKLVKRASSVEAIAAKLSELTADVNGLVSESHMAYSSIEQSLMKFQKQWSQERTEADGTTKALEDFLTELNNQNSKVSDIISKAFELGLRLADWRTHESVRLAVWLEDGSAVVSRLRKLALEQLELVQKTMDITGVLTVLVGDINEELFPTLASRKEDIEDNLQVASKHFSEINALRHVYTMESLKIEALLAEKMTRDPPTFGSFLKKSLFLSEMLPGSSSDGLLVSLARQVEKGVRWLLRLK